MPTTHGHTWTALVAVRVPRDSPDSLVDSARRRLETPAGIRTVDVTALRAIDPALAATTATVVTVVETPGEVDSATVRERLANAPGSQQVADVEPTGVATTE
jgi:hypothetical protein